MTTPTPLSPAAQAVLDAVIDQWDADRRPIASPLAAAALLAAAHNVDWESGDPKSLILAIAAELEGRLQ